jgi:hypothetical protein
MSSASRWQTGGCRVRWLSARELIFCATLFPRNNNNHEQRQSIELFVTANRMSTDGCTSSQCKPWCECQLSEVGGGRREAQSDHRGPRPKLSPDRLPPRFSNRHRRGHVRRNRLKLSYRPRATQISKISDFQPNPTRNRKSLVRSNVKDIYHSAFLVLNNTASAHLIL